MGDWPDAPNISRGVENSSENRCIVGMVKRDGCGR